jgi:hypothetical protein
MNSKMVLLTTLAVWGLLLPGSAKAQQTYSYSYAYIRHIEGDFQIQRATELEPSEATVNHPILSGDRVWMDAPRSSLETALFSAWTREHGSISQTSVRTEERRSSGSGAEASSFV